MESKLADDDSLEWVAALARRADAEGLTELAAFLDAHQAQLAVARREALRRGSPPTASPFVYALR